MGSVTAELARSSTAARPTGATEPTKPTKAGAGGRPRRGVSYARVHITLAEDLAQYVNDAWRTHRRSDGSYASGPSGFIEDLVARHKAAAEETR
jgi:hypothetical protein